VPLHNSTLISFSFLLRKKLSSTCLNLWLFIHRTGQVHMILFEIARNVISCLVEELIQLHKVVSTLFLLSFNYNQALFCLKIGFDNFFINWIKIKRDSMSKSGNSCRDLHLFAIRICPFGGSWGISSSCLHSSTYKCSKSWYLLMHVGRWVNLFSERFRCANLGKLEELSRNSTSEKLPSLSSLDSRISWILQVL